MVGHTGVFEAAVKACEAVDKCIEAVATTAYEHGYAVFILADHGNSDYMINPDGTPNTPVSYTHLDVYKRQVFTLTCEIKTLGYSLR